MAKKKARVNIYKHSIDLSDLKIKNQPKDKFREALEKIKYRGYEVEQVSDGKGRAMSWEGWKKLEDGRVKTGDGILDLKEKLKKSFLKKND